MKKMIVIALVVLAMVLGVAFMYSCGGGGGGGDETVDLDMDGYDSSLDCDDSASSCTDDCVSDVDGDGILDCLDLCIDTDLDGYGTDNSATVVGSGPDDVGSCTSDGVTACAGGGAVCLGLDCDDDPSGGFSVNPGVTELCGDGVDNNCDDLLDCYDTVICADDSACNACTDGDLDGYLILDASCSGGDDCDDSDFDTNPGGTGEFSCDPELCSPCTTNADCWALTGGQCEPIDGELRCTSECIDNSDCPSEYTCIDLGGGDKQCIPTSDSCTCLPADDEATRACEQTNGYGTCVGTETCDSSVGWTACTAPTPEAETCDGQDNDCDGPTDEGFTDLGDSCSTGVGICYDSGNKVCTGDGTGTECDAVAGTPTTETCNSLDDDCDGNVDEDYGPIGVVRYTDWDGSQLYKGESCGTGACSGGEVVCLGDGTVLTCSTLDNVATEICNGTDDDCDGSTDENTDGECGLCEKCGGGSCINQSLGEDVKGDCSDFTCTQFVWGLSGTNCYRYASATANNGDCSGVGSCASLSQSCTGLGSILASCGDAGCVKACPSGGLASSYNTVSEVCYTDSLQHGCGVGLVCDASGSCVP